MSKIKQRLLAHTATIIFVFYGFEEVITSVFDKVLIHIHVIFIDLASERWSTYDLFIAFLIVGHDWWRIESLCVQDCRQDD